MKFPGIVGLYVWIQLSMWPCQFRLVPIDVITIIRNKTLFTWIKSLTWRIRMMRHALLIRPTQQRIQDVLRIFFRLTLKVCNHSSTGISVCFIFQMSVYQQFHHQKRNHQQRSKTMHFSCVCRWKELPRMKSAMTISKDNNLVSTHWQRVS
jgi:hypothetical protein